MNLINAYFNKPNISYKSTPKKDFVNKNSASKMTAFYLNDLHGQIPKMQRLVSASNYASICARETNSDLLKLSSGDIFIGSDKERNKVGASFLDIAGIDAETLGNHELDINANICGNLLKNTKTKILGMNMNFPDNKSELSRKVVRSTVIEKQSGEKYGIIGLQPSDINHRLKDKSKLEGITIDDEQQTLVELQEEVNLLRKQGLNKILLLSHEGSKLEKEIAQKIDGIDIIFGGHSHDLINGVKEGENLFYSPSGEPVVITQAGRDGDHFGLLNVEFNDKGQITYVNNNILDTNTYAPSLLMSKFVDKVLGESPVIGKLNYVDPLPVHNLIEENPWADFVGDAIKDTLNADVVLINSANFRGSVDIGTITERDISSIFPFGNKLYKVKINEKDLVDALKFCGKSLSNEHNKPGILQVSGLTYTLDHMGELKELYYIDKNGSKNYININNPDSNKVYTAVYDEFLIGGGDKLEMLKRQESEILEKYDFSNDKVTIDFIKQFDKPFDVQKDNRIKILA